MNEETERPHYWPYKTAMVIVAHPDDEVLWAGGTILLHPETRWNIYALCRGKDPDRAPKFFRVQEILQAEGRIGDLDDEPEQKPLPLTLVKEAIQALLLKGTADVIISHGPYGEYTRHLRHEEVSAAVHQLWQEGILRSSEFWQFAYSDDNGLGPVHPSVNSE